MTTDEQHREEIRTAEKAETSRAFKDAVNTGRNVSFIAEDGCEVTVTPNGQVFYNAVDWW